jgi:lactoylglutathione lyase
MALKIKGIAHIAYSVHDMDKTLSLYRDILGLPVAFNIERDGKPWIEYVKVAQEKFIEFFYPGPTDDFAKDITSYNHLCLGVEDIFATEKALDAAEYPVDIRPKQGNDGNWQMWVVDPDGNRIELMQISPDSPQAKA